MRVIARAYGDEPLQRVVTGECGKLVYLLNPSVADANGAPEMSGVGFPLSAVYRFDLPTFESLCLAWRSGNKQELRAAWAKARLYRHQIMDSA